MMVDETSHETVPLPTSAVLHDLLREAPGGTVTVAWVLDQLDERSFGLVMLLLAVLALVPGLSLIAGLLITWPATQMVLNRPRPTLPHFAGRRSVSMKRLRDVIGRVVPLLRWLERFIHPRWPTPFVTTKRTLGVVLFLLGVSLVSVVPFSHIIPAIVIMGVALAYLERDGVMLALALAAAVVSLVATGVTIWAAVYGLEGL